MSFVPSFAVLLYLSLVRATFAAPNNVEEHIFDATVDHYRFHINETFPLRYFVNEDNWDPENGACFFYAGNEANIWQFINNSGFLFEAAEDFGALVVFAEHRYYGESQLEDIGYLSVEQAMADFNTLNGHIREKWLMRRDTPFVVFGGSYGGNLALWLRLKNPNLWAGAIASSATPLKHLLRETNGFARIETEVYANVSQKCPALVRAGWRMLYDGSLSDAANALGLCQPLRRSEVELVHGWVSDALETMVQYGYPYPTNFYNPVPAYPFRVACERMLRTGTGLGALRSAVDVYYNYTGQAGQCYDLHEKVTSEAFKHWQKKGDMSRLREQEDLRAAPTTLRQERRDLASMRGFSLEEAWGYQTCTEVYQPMPTNGVTDFEVPYTPNKESYFAHCRNQWGVEPRPNWEEMTFMGSNIQAGSNIFLTNGQFDPWRAAGIQEKPRGAPDSIVVRIIENGAHHLDLRSSHPLDPPSVIAVRNEEKAAMRQWIKQWKETYSYNGIVGMS